MREECQEENIYAENSTCNYGGRNRKSFWKRNQAACTGGTMWRDYYGKEAYVKVHDYLVQEQQKDGKLHICMAGFRLGNTLSDNGSVTRGICHIENGQLTGVTETHDIFKTATGAESRNADGSVQELDVKDLVSMNMWGLTPDFMEILEKGFSEFLSGLAPEDTKKEYLLPELVDHLIKNKSAEVDVL